MVLHKGLKAPGFCELQVLPSLGWGNLHMAQTGSSFRMQDIKGKEAKD